MKDGVLPPMTLSRANNRRLQKQRPASSLAVARAYSSLAKTKKTGRQELKVDLANYLKQLLSVASSFNSNKQEYERLKFEVLVESIFIFVIIQLTFLLSSILRSNGF